MKYLVTLFAVSLLLISCEKEENENTCAIIGLESIPKSVTDGFTAKYPGVTVENWFDKNGAFVASFEKDRKDLFAKFGSDGNFITEFKEDDSEYESGCECEDEDED